jgi:hypothetical protein
MSKAKNVDSMARLLGFCSGLGGNYNPAQQNLQVASLATLVNEARNMVAAVTEAQRDHDIAVNHRMSVFRDLQTLICRVNGELKSSGASKFTVADAQTLIRKIRGHVRAQRAPVPSAQANEPEALVATRRARGQDYISIVQHMAGLLELLKKEPSYMPHVADLQLEQLKVRVAELHAANTDVMATYVTLSNLRKKRDSLFNGKEGVYERAQAVKHKILSMVGYNNPVFQEVRKIRFTKN